MTGRGRYRNAGKRRHHGTNRRGAEYSSPYQDPRWPKLKAQVLHRDGYKCVRCGSRNDLQADHVVPLSVGGEPFGLDNLQTLCGTCNRTKGVSAGFMFDMDTGMFEPGHSSHARGIDRVNFL